MIYYRNILLKGRKQMSEFKERFLSLIGYKPNRVIIFEADNGNVEIYDYFFKIKNHQYLSQYVDKDFYLTALTSRINISYKKVSNSHLNDQCLLAHNQYFYGSNRNLNKNVFGGFQFKAITS